MATEGKVDETTASTDTSGDPTEGAEASLQSAPAAPPAGLDAAGLVAGLASIEAQLAEFNRRSTHREAVIDRLHTENQELRAGLRRAILEPAVIDLMRLHDGLSREAMRLGDDGSAALMRSFAGDVELILDRCGIEPFSAEPGQPYRPGEHRPLGAVPTDHPERDNTVAEVTAIGFREREGGRVRRPLQARFYRYHPPEDAASGGDAPRASEETKER